MMNKVIRLVPTSNKCPVCPVIRTSYMTTFYLLLAGWPANKRRCLSLFNYCNTVSDKKGFNATDGAAFISEVTHTLTYY